MKAYKEQILNRNLDILQESGLPFTYNPGPRVIMIRVPMVSADFYPTMNKWKDNLCGQTIHYGDADQLLKWICQIQEERDAK